MELLKLLKYSFLFIPVLSFCQTKRAIMEGTPASNNTILISTDTKSVSIATTASNGYTLNVLGSINTTSYFLNGVPFSGGYTSFVIDDFTSQTNGSQTQFTLSQQPLNNSLQVSKNGLVLKSTADYSLSGQIITMVTAPSSNTALMAMYAIGVSTDEATIIQDGNPIGSFIAYSSTISPQGYLYCDGRWLNKNSYPDLFAVTGYRYSTFTITSGDWFQLPDLRGMFLRGEDSFNVKGLGFRVIGSTQTDAFQAHKHLIHSVPWHDYPGGWKGGGWFGDPGWWPELSSDTFLEISGYGTPRIATETRPMNTAVAYHIKYANIGTATIKLSSSNVILASSNTWSATNTFNNNTIFKSSITINANPSQQYALTIDSNSNSTDGYIVSISTIGEINYINQIGRFIDKQNFDNVTSVTILNLSFNKNYKLLYNLRPNTTSGRFYLRFNNVTSQYYYALLTIAHSGNTGGIGSGSATSIPLDYTNNTIGMYMHGDLSFSCYKRSSDNNYITFMYGGGVQFRNDSYLSRNTYSGLLNTTTNPLSSVTIFTDATSMTGDIYLYEEVVK